MEGKEFSEGEPLISPLISPLIAPPCPEAWLAQLRRAREVSAEWLQCAGFFMTGLAILLCALFYFTCQKCLFGVLLFCAVLCPCVHPLNAPLWLAIVLLTMSGWSFTAGAFSISWNAKSG